jgi:hypothetical protein
VCASLVALLDGREVELPAEEAQANAGQVGHAAALHEHHAVLCEVVPLARDEREHISAVRELHARAFAVARVGLLRLADEQPSHDAAKHRVSVERCASGLVWGSVEAVHRDSVHSHCGGLFADMWNTTQPFAVRSLANVRFGHALEGGS